MFIFLFSRGKIFMWPKGAKCDETREFATSCNVNLASLNSCVAIVVEHKLFDVQGVPKLARRRALTDTVESK